MKSLFTALGLHDSSREKLAAGLLQKVLQKPAKAFRCTHEHTGSSKQNRHRKLISA